MFRKENSYYQGLPILILAALVAIYTYLSYPDSLSDAVFAATVFCCLVVWVVVRIRGWNTETILSPVNLLLIAVSLLSAVQSIYSHHYYTIQSPNLEKFSVYSQYLIACHFGFVIFLLLKNDRPGVKLLYGAALCSSISYLPGFQTPEGSVPFLSIELLALASVYIAWQQRKKIKVSNSYGLILALLGAFLFLILLSVIYSYEPQVSILWWLKLLALVVLAVSSRWLIFEWNEWKNLLIFACFASLFPMILSGVQKFIEIWNVLGWRVAVFNRMNIAEFGRSNLVTRELMVSMPVLFGFWWSARNRLLKFGLCVSLVLCVMVLALCQSWGGLLGVGLAVGAGLVLVNYQKLALSFQNLPAWVKKWPVLLAIGLTCAVTIFGLSRIALAFNVGSYNGRLFQFRSALMQIWDHPLGVGAGVYHVKAQYAKDVPWLEDTQFTIDNPLVPVNWYRESTTYHFHNLFLEIGSAAGIPGIVVFLTFLYLLISYLVRLRSKVNREEHRFLTMIFVSLIAELGWGLLDVLQIMPPFFSTSVWVYVGLILAVETVLQDVEEPSKSGWLLRMIIWRGWSNAAAVSLAVGVLLFTSGNWYYRRGFTAFEKHDWNQTITELTFASIFEPLNAKYAQIRGEARINQGQYAEATLDFQWAARLKRGFSLYENKLGWLAWLNGDLQGAETHLKEAVRLDPLEAWKPGLHNDLGLLQAATGQKEQALENFREAIKSEGGGITDHPWQTVFQESRGFDVVVDPAYAQDRLNAPGNQVLQTRILAKLGKANYTSQLFEWIEPDAKSISFNEVLSGLELDYEELVRRRDRKAPAVFASLTEAARMNGMVSYTEKAYLAYQADFPDSVYGFRELGLFYLEQGRLKDAKDQLDKAVAVNENEPNTWLAMAQVSAAMQDWESATRSLEKAFPKDKESLALRYEMEKKLSLKKRDLSLASEALKKLLYVQESSLSRLDLADLVNQLGRSELARNECRTAANLLLLTYPNPFDSQWFRLAGCLASMGEDSQRDVMGQISHQNPMMAGILRGHLLRLKGDFGSAAAEYEQASLSFPGEAAPKYFLGQVYISMRKNDLAETALKQASENTQLESLPLLALGQLQFNSGWNEEAIRTVKKAAQMTPGSREVWSLLGNLYLWSADRANAEKCYSTVQAIKGWKEEEIFSFTENLAQASIKTPQPEMVKLDSFQIEGLDRTVLFMHPDSEVQFRLALPSEKVGFAFAPLLSPDSWSEAGDGVVFEVLALTDHGEEKIYSRYVDPKKNYPDRLWKVDKVDLSAFAGQEVILILRTNRGPNGDNRFDWAGWAEPFLVKSTQ